MMYRLPVKLSLFGLTRPELSKLNTNLHSGTTEQEIIVNCSPSR